MYHERLMAYYKDTRFRGHLSDVTVQSGEINPSCGDTITLYVRIDDNQIADIRFDAQGCVMTQAAAALLCESVLGSGVMHASKVSPEDMKALIGIELGLNRLRCVLLPLEALHTAIRKYTHAQ